MTEAPDVLAELRAVIDSATTVVVAHPDDATAIRAAASQPGVPLIEVVENPHCPEGTAYAFPKSGGALTKIPLP